jgi:hypothetical protein
MTTRWPNRLRLGWLASPFGSHPAAWLHPDARPEATLNLAHYTRMVQIPEAGKLDFVFQADVPAARHGNMIALRRAPRFMSIWEPLTLLSALAPATTHPTTSPASMPRWITSAAAERPGTWSPRPTRPPATISAATGWSRTPCGTTGYGNSSRWCLDFGIAGMTTRFRSTRKRQSISIPTRCTICGTREIL